jgi:hypothetical protein
MAVFSLSVSPLRRNGQFCCSRFGSTSADIDRVDRTATEHSVGEQAGAEESFGIPLIRELLQIGPEGLVLTAPEFMHSDVAGMIYLLAHL